MIQANAAMQPPAGATHFKLQNGKQIGNFTVCAMFKTMPAEEVARYKKDRGFVCSQQRNP